MIMKKDNDFSKKIIGRIPTIKTNKDAVSLINSIDNLPKKEYYINRIKKAKNITEEMYSIVLDLEGLYVSKEKDYRFCKHHDRKQGWWD